MLLQYQLDNLSKLNQAAKESNKLVIVGARNSGRQYVIEQWSQNVPNALIIKLHQTSLNFEYASLVTALKEAYKNDIKKTSIAASFSLSILSLGIGISLEDESLLLTENKIITYLKQLSKKYSIIFIINNSINITDGSIELIEKFINKKKHKKNRYYEFILSEKAINESSCLYFQNISNSKSDKSDILKQLNLNPQIILSNKVVEFIFSNISDNIKLLNKVVEDINNNKLDFNFEKYDINNTTKALLEECTKNYTYSRQLKDLLTICAIAKHCFQTIDFAFLLKENESAIKLLLKYAQEHYLLENDVAGYRIVFGIVEKIYGTLDEMSKNKIYNNIVHMLANVYPSDYYNKYIFANLADDPSSTIYLMQHLFKEIRLNHNINLCDYKTILNTKQYNIVKKYNISYGLINAKKYTESIDTLNSLKDLSGALLYEINILKSQCLIKEIHEICRKDALRCLSYQRNNTAIDEDLKFRLDTRKIAAFIHVGEYEQAMSIYNDVKDRMLQILSQTNALQYEYYLNIIYRKYSYISDYELSINEVKQSVDFFRKHKKMYYNAYYIALNNLFSLYIINMNLEKALKVKNEIEQLQIEKNAIKFSREEILQNNFILYNYFAGNISINVAIESFKILYDTSEGIADHIFIASNYAVFMMLNNDLLHAKNILVKEIENVENDKEGVYNYRISINLAICDFLIDNSKRAECILKLKKIQYNQEDPHYKVRNTELKEIINLMDTIDICNNASTWCETYKSRITTLICAYTTYQQGLIFTTLFNWDDD